MARQIAARTTLRCWLRAQTALHAGGTADLPGVDDAVARDLSGRPVVRGSALAGVLSAALGVDPASSRDDAWGWVSGQDGRAGRIWVEDALVGAAPASLDEEPPEAGGDSWWREPRPERRDGVGIDRASGAAAARVLYARQVVGAGAVLAVRISVDSPYTVDDAQELLARMLGVFRKGLRLGARTSRGLGLLRLAGAYRVERVSYESADAFLDTLLAPAPVAVPVPSSPPDAGAVVEVRWHPRRSVLVAADSSCDLVDILPLVTADPEQPLDHVRLVLPGSGIAGALRGRAELIARTVRGVDPAGTFADQIGQQDLVTALFGGAAHRDRPDAGRSVVMVDDSLSEQTIDRKVWQDLVLAPLAGPTDRRLRERERIARRQELAGHGLHVVDRVALDRWTGGAAKGKLYSRLEPVGFSYRPLRLEVALDRLPVSLRDAAGVLLLLTIRDLRDGWVTLGAGTTQGLGEVVVDEVAIDGLWGVEGVLDTRWWTEELPRLPAVAAWRRWCDNDAEGT